MESPSFPPIESRAPPHDHDHAASLISQLQRSEIFRDYQRAFETTTGLPLALRMRGSFQAPLHGSKHVNPFCRLMAQRSKSCAACLRLQQQVEDQAAQEPKTLECFAGLSESAMPVRADDRLVGYLQTGQVFLRAPTKAGFKRFLREAGVASDPDAIREFETAYFRTRVLDANQYGAILRLLSIFAQHLAEIVRQALIRQATAELPAVTKAKNFMAERVSDELTLEDVASAVGMSSFYFCKIFKRTTGQTFTLYLARLRVDTVKNLLLNPETRISEAAYAAGFQSLSQFNRVFRRVAGESPTVFREKLHGSSSLPRCEERSKWTRLRQDQFVTDA